MTVNNPFAGKNKDKYITRIDTKNTHGWQIRIAQYEPQGVSKFFSDSLHSGKWRCRTATRAYRDKVYDQLPQKFKRVFLNNKGPVNMIWGKGYFRSVRTCIKNDYPYWTGAYYKNDHCIRKTFAVGRYGEDQAKALAMKFRLVGEVGKTRKQ